MASNNARHQNPRGRGHGKRANQNVKLSKLLSYTLRHGAVKEGLEMCPAGFVKVSDLLAHEKFEGYVISDIRQVVAENDKQRFCLVEDEKVVKIRANQGHSLEVPDLALSPLAPNEILVALHGTYEKCIKDIKKNGLSRMGRQHIHMAVSEPGADGVISGMRGSCDYIVRVNVGRAQQDGLKFYRSSNNVILCEGNQDGFIPPKYFDSVILRHQT